MSYCTVDDVKLYLSITSNTDDALLTRITNAATAIIETITKRVFEEPETDETRVYFTKNRLSENNGVANEFVVGDDFLSITSITNYNGSNVNLANILQLPFNIFPKWIIKFTKSSGLHFGYCEEDDKISITGKFAYSSTPPEDIKQAAIRLTAWLYKQKDGGADLDRPILSGEGTVVLPAHLPQDVELFLKPYIKEDNW